AVQVGAHTYAQTGIYRDTLTAANGCDSIVTTMLTVLPQIAENQSFTRCHGQSVQVGGHTYAQTGIYRDTLTAANGCDSIVTTMLTVLPQIAENQSFTRCFGQSVQVGAHTYAQTGIYRDTLAAANGCDSIVTTALEILSALTSNAEQSICAGESVVFGEETLRESGIYKDTLVATSGCDSIAVLQLTVGNLSVALPTDTSFVPGSSPVSLSPILSPDTSAIDQINWFPTTGLSCSDCLVPLATPTETSVYYIEVIDERGCTATDSVLIRVQKDIPAKIFIPSAFRPSSEVGNHVFGVFGGTDVIQVNRLLVFDRWGGLIFEAEDFPADGKTGWDGTVRHQTALPGVYVYVAEILLHDGSTLRVKGEVTKF
ncbi:MAG: gliding motility-associated C-terminal domain-containing protein, partial [Saprospiraceae bacterium]